MQRRLFGGMLLAGVLLVLPGLCLASAAGAAGPLARTSHRGPLTFEAGGRPLAAEAPIEAVATDFVLKDHVFKVECQRSVLVGTLATNGREHKDLIEVRTVSFEGGDPLDEELCSSRQEFRLGWHPLDPASLELFFNGRVEMTHGRLWLSTAAWEEEHEHVPQCELVGHGRTDDIRGSFAVGESPQPFVLSFEDPKVQLKKADAPVCARSSEKVTPELTVSYTFSSEGAPVEVLGGAGEKR